MCLYELNFISWLKELTNNYDHLTFKINYLVWLHDRRFVDQVTAYFYVQCTVAQIPSKVVSTILYPSGQKMTV